MKRGYSANEVVEAIKGSGGFVTAIARRLNCTARHVYNLIQKYESAREALFDEREAMRDMAEGELYKKIKNGDTTAIIFYLKTQAKERGYVERQEVTGAGGGEVTIRIEGVIDDAGDG